MIGTGSSIKPMGDPRLRIVTPYCGINRTRAGMGEEQGFPRWNLWYRRICSIQPDQFGKNLFVSFDD